MDEKKESAAQTQSASINDVISMMEQTSVGSNKYKSYSLEDSVSETQSKINDLANQTVSLHDHYGNTLASVGTSDKVESFTNYGFSNDTLNWTLWLALYNDSWVFRRAIDKPAQDEVACGFSLHGKSDFSKIYKTYDKYKSDMVQLLQWGALFGGSIAVMMFENIKSTDMASPLPKSKIKGKRFKLYVTDRWYGGFADTSEMVTDMRDIDYGKPAYYNVCFPDGKQYRIHHSYVLRYEHRSAPPLIKNGQLQGWGYAEGAHILNELSRDDQIKSAVASLVNKSLIEVIKMSGMRGVFMGTDKGNEAQLMKRLEMVNWGRTYNSLTFLDKDDEYEQYNLSALTGLADLMDKNMWLIGAALEMQGVLYGDLKGGLGQESDAMNRYANTINTRCNAWFRPVLHKFLLVLFAIEEINEPVDFEFNSLIKDEVNKEIVASIGSLADLLSKLEQNGIISKYQAAKSMSDYINNDSITISITEEYLHKLKLEEEQQILDTIEELTKKGRRIEKPNFDIGISQQQTEPMNVPITSPQEGELANESIQNEESEEQPVQEEI